MDDFRELAALIGIEKHWQPDDAKDTLSVERARYWRQVITLAHIPQLVLAQQLHNNEKPNPDKFRQRVSDLLTKRALVFLALDWAIDHNQPVRWPDMIH